MDYSIWDKFLWFTAEEAAHLWFEIHPNQENIPDETRLKIKAMQRLLDEELSGGKGKMHRRELRAYANGVFEKPLFLFPEERGSKEDGGYPGAVIAETAAGKPAQAKENTAQAPNVNQTPEPDPENFVRALKVCYQSNLEVKIQEPRKRPQTWNRDAMGFGLSGKQWEIFLGILQDRGEYKLPVSYTVSEKAHRTKEYDRERDYLNQINKKLIAFLQKNYAMPFRPKFKVYEIDPKAGRRVYRLKFKTEESLPRMEKAGGEEEEWKKIYEQDMNRELPRSKKRFPPDSQE